MTIHLSDRYFGRTGERARRAAQRLAEQFIIEGEPEDPHAFFNIHASSWLHARPEALPAFIDALSGGRSTNFPPLAPDRAPSFARDATGFFSRIEEENP